MFGLGMSELLLVLIVALVIFGASKLPEIGEGLGKGIKSFKKSVSGDDEIDVTPEKDKKIKGDDREEAKKK